MPECLNYATPRLFADDTNLTVAGNTVYEIELAMNEDLDCIKEWLLANKLSLNVAKTEFKVIGTNKKLKSLNNNQPSIKIVRLRSNKSIIAEYLELELMINYYGISILIM